MEVTILTTMLFKAIGGLGLFLLGMKYMSDGVQAFAGDRLRQLIGMVTNNRLIAVTVGVLFTCIVQSSSITTVLVVGLVNSGVMTLLQAIGVIIGANIGTTITGWILVLKVGKYGLPMLGAASFFYLFSKNERVRFIGMLIMGIGMIFFGLELMKNGFKPMRSVPEFVEWFALFDASTYLGILKCAMVGCLLTFIVQSSSATLAITMGLASTGIIEFESAAALVLGENIGTTITAWLASLGAGTNAKRAAYAHVVFNIIGVTWIIAVFPIYIAAVKTFLGLEPGAMVMEDGSATYPYVILGIATVHTGFNVTNTLIFIPLMKYLEMLLVKLIPEKAMKEEVHLTHLASGIFEAPAVAIENSRKEIIRMSEIVLEMMDYLKTSLTVGGKEEEPNGKIFRREEALDRIQNEVSIFLTELLASDIPHNLVEEGRSQLRMADEYESVSDYIAGILKLQLRLKNGGLDLPELEKKEILKLHDDIKDYIILVNGSLNDRYREILIKANTQSEALTHEVRRMRNQHLERLSKERKEPLITMIFADMINQYRRVKDHTLNIAEAVAGKK